MCLTSSSSRLVLTLLLLAAPLSAEVVSSAAHGFEVRSESLIDATPESIWAALGQIDRWWETDHTYSGDTKNLSLETRRGGCFCEKLPSGGAVTHLTVLHADPPRLLRLQGGLGPLQAMGVSGTLSIGLEGTDKGTTVTFTYAIVGFRAQGMAEFAPAVDGVLAAQLGGLARLLNPK